MCIITCLSCKNESIFTWFGERMKKGNGTGESMPLFGQSSSDISDKLSLKPPPWSIMPSPINLHSHHWSTLLSYLYSLNYQIAQVS